MRVPLRKIYRAFPELDQYSDELCERFMRRIAVSGGKRLLPELVFVAIFFFGLLLVSPAAGFVYQQSEAWLGTPARNRYEWMIGLGILIVTFFVPASFALFARDAMLRRHLRQVIHDKLNRIRCLSCKYILIGQVVADEMVTCAECGRRHRLSELGIEAADLIPPTNRTGAVESV